MIAGNLMLLVGVILFFMSAVCIAITVNNLSAVDKSKSKIGIFLNKGGWALLSTDHLNERGIKYKKLAFKFIMWGFIAGFVGVLNNSVYLIITSV